MRNTNWIRCLESDTQERESQGLSGPPSSSDHLAISLWPPYWVHKGPKFSSVPVAKGQNLAFTDYFLNFDYFKEKEIHFNSRRDPFCILCVSIRTVWGRPHSKLQHGGSCQSRALESGKLSELCSPPANQWWLQVCKNSKTHSCFSYPEVARNSFWVRERQKTLFT